MSMRPVSYSHSALSNTNKPIFCSPIFSRIFSKNASVSNPTTAAAYACAHSSLETLRGNGKSVLCHSNAPPVASNAPLYYLYIFTARARPSSEFLNVQSQ